MLDTFEVSKVLIIAPLRVARDTWPAEIEKWDHLKGLDISVIVGDVKTRIAAVHHPAMIYVVNRENIKWLVEYYEKNGMRWDFSMVVIDELSSFKNYQSQRFKYLRKVRPYVRRWVGLTGTPSSNGLMDLWAEIGILDGGERLGKFIGRYREAYFKRRGSRASVFTNLTCGEEYHGRTCGEKLFRIGYNNALPGYTDNRSLAAEGIDPEGYSERYYYYYPVWRCTKNAQGTPHGCTSGSTYECALEQSFMENLYWLKRDLEANGDDSWLMRQFAAACEKMERASGRNSYSTQRLQTVEMQIRELEEKLNKTVANQVEAMRIEALEKTAEAKHTLENGSTDDVPVDIMSGISTVGLGTQWFCGDEINSDSEAAIYEELANDIRDRIADLKKERDALELEQGATTIARKNFDFFVRCLKALPETNFAGMKMNVNGLDVQGSLFRDMEGKAIAGKRSSARSGHIKITEEKLAAAPDYLNFEKGIYTAFIKSGVVKGDTVEYQTNFGVTLVTTGNSRNLSSFLGFRRANPDGTVMFLDEKWKVSGRSVCYTRKKLKDKDKPKRRESMTEEKRKKGEDMLRLIELGSVGN